MKNELNKEPIDIRVLAKSAGVSIERALEFMDEVFGGYANYVRACDDVHSNTLETKLEMLQKEL